MFIDSKPISLYSHGSHSSRSSLAAMENPRPQMLRRPPAVLSHSSSSLSLSPLERSIPSFQSFVKRTPTPNREKPLPPVPGDGSQVISPTPRRSSSIYSRTVSQYAHTPESWTDDEYANHPLPQLFLQPAVYSLSTPELTLEMPSKSLLPPRPYAPLIASPSPSPSRKSTPSPPPEQRSAELLPPALPMLRVATQHIRTVSLDKAKAALRSPDVQPLLPEEMRALAAAKKAKEQLLRTSQSFEGVILPRTPTLPYSSNPSPALPALTPLDWPLPKTDSLTAGSKLSDEYFGTSKESRLSMSPVERQLKIPVEISITGPEEPPVSDYEPRRRDRTKSQRGSSKRVNDYDSKEPIREKTSETSANEKLISEAQRLANEYHALFREEMQLRNGGQRKHSASSSSVREAMKMVPQPLFFNPRAISKQRTLQYQKELSRARYSPSNQSLSSQATRGSPGLKEPELKFPYKLSLTPESTGMTKRRRSTSGSIPISPPFAPPDPDVWLKNPSPNTSTHRKNSIDDSNRFSAFYRRINADAAQMAREYNKPGNKVMWELDTSTTTTTSSIPPLISTSAFSPSTPTTPSPIVHRKASTASSTQTSKTQSSTTKQKVKFGGTVTSVFHHHIRKSSLTAVEGFSNLVDNIKQRRPSFPIISSPQPIDASEAYKEIRQTDNAGAGMSKKSGLLRGIRENRRESKANKRRDELKRTIKVVGGAAAAVEQDNTGENGKKGQWL